MKIKSEYIFIGFLVYYFINNEDDSFDGSLTHKPLKNPVKTSGFGPRTHPITKKPQFHNGIDLAAPFETPIFAVADGIVEESKLSKGSGNFILLDHKNGFKTRYNHMIRLSLFDKGQMVRKGQIIGYVGSTGVSTGPHLHFTILKNGEAVDPLSVMPHLLDE